MKVYNPQPPNILDKDLIRTLEFLRQRRNFDASSYLKTKCTLLNNYMKNFKLSSCVVAISGGVDSAVTLGIILNASLDKNSPIKKIIPVLLPVYAKDATTNQKEAFTRGKEVIKKFNLNPIVIDLTKSHKLVKKTVDTRINIKGKGWASGQLVSYIRTPVLYYITSLQTQKNMPAIVCGTTNRDEGAYLGYFGKASDGMVDVQLISDIHKSEVYKIAKLLNIPQNIIKATPSGDMFDGRSDEEVFGAPYDFVELYLLYLSIKDKKEKEDLIKSWSKSAKKQFHILSKRLEKLHKYNQHKYIGGSTSIHLDVYERTVPGGWNK